MRLVFGVVNMLPLEILEQKKVQGNPIGYLEGFSLINNSLQEMCKDVSSEHKGLEFRFGS